MSKDKEKHNAYMRDYMKRYIAAMTPERRAEWNAMKKENDRKRFLNPLTKARRNEIAKRSREKREAAMTPEQLAEANKRKWVYEQRRLENPEARALRRASAKRYSRAKYEKGGREYQRDYKVMLKYEMLGAYGPGCACCGETEPAFLVLDHVHGDGAAHRRATKREAGYAMYLYLKKQGWPKGFQVLCSNCNSAKGTKKECPHARLLKEKLQMNSLRLVASPPETA